MKKKRVKHNYEFIIKDWELEKDFDSYCLKHENVNSRKRLARSFLTGLGLKRVIDLPCYILGQEEPYLIYIARLIREKKIMVEE